LAHLRASLSNNDEAVASAITKDNVTIVLPVLNEEDAVSTVIELLEYGYTGNVTLCM
jgi:hypothetical protein